MRKIAFIFTISAAMFVTACGNDENPSTEKENKKKEEAAKGPEVDPEEMVAVNAVANEKIKIGVKGMTCAIGCKGAIEKSLSKTPGVTQFNVGFDENEEMDETIIEFDNTLVSGEEIVASIEALNDGAYKIEEVEKLAME